MAKEKGFPYERCRYIQWRYLSIGVSFLFASYSFYSSSLKSTQPHTMCAPLGLAE